MGAFEHFPVIESLAPLGRDKCGAAIAVDVPFPDEGGFVSDFAQNFGNGNSVRGERDVVEEHAVGEGSLAGKE